jgi:formate dehydrogenase subunit gamma
VFWGVLLGGIAVLASGVTLMFPFHWFGYDGMQWAQLIHALVGLLMVALIIGHIYIGTVGMEGAVDAMWSGRVDRNWAKEHHDLWYESIAGERRPSRPAAPAK